MPKIEAENVRAHRARRLEALVEAATQILASDGVEGLTAGAVASRAGIARNSIYRYFDSMDDLIELVVTQEFPAWAAAVAQAVAAETTPREQAVAYVRANVELAARGTHRNHAALSRRALTPAGRDRVKAMHTTLSDTLTRVVRGLGSTHPELMSAVIQSLVDACIRRIDAGDDLSVVRSFAEDGTRKLLSSQ